MEPESWWFGRWFSFSIGWFLGSHVNLPGCTHPIFETSISPDPTAGMRRLRTERLLQFVGWSPSHVQIVQHSALHSTFTNTQNRNPKKVHKNKKNTHTHKCDKYTYFFKWNTSEVKGQELKLYRWNYQCNNTWIFVNFWIVSCWPGVL